jgi:TalC/MipB family fructose-6-phosphate aldolase
MTKFLKIKDCVDKFFAAVALCAKFISACFLLIMIVAVSVQVLGRIFHFKIPVTEEGLKAIKVLKARGFKITATAVYTQMQGLVAIAAGADYIAPYFNRIESRGEDAAATIAAFRNNIDFSGAKTKILAASFHTGKQVSKAIAAGADAITIQPKLLTSIIHADYIDEAVETFAEDWKMSQGSNNLLDC